MTYSELRSVLEQKQLDVAVDGTQLVLHGSSSALTAELKEAVRSHRQALVDELSGGATLQPDEASRYEPFPLTEIQQAYWLGRNSLFELGGVGIHVYEELNCQELDVDRLEQAWQRIIDRHDMLRSVVCAEGSQRVLPQARYRFDRVDLSSMPASEQTECLAAWRERLSHKVYAPEQWPLFDFVVCHVSAGLSRLLISMDAIHIDMRSFQLLFREWVSLYQNTDGALPEISISYRDYALALNRLRGSAAWQRDWNYWKKIAAQLPQAPELPLEQPLRSIRDHRFERRRGTLNASDWKRLKSLAASTGLTPSGVTLAAYAEVLARWSANPAFTVNVTLFNALPLHPDVGKLAGDFTSMLLLSVDGDTGTFSDRARALQNQLHTGLEHRLVSGIRVLREYASNHRLESQQAVFPVVFTSTLNEATRGLEPLERLGERCFGSIQTPQVLLDLQVSERAGELVFQLDAVQDVFPEGCLNAMHAAWQDLLIALARGERWSDSDAFPIEYPKRIAPDSYEQAPGGTLFDFCRSGTRDYHATALIDADGRRWTRGEFFKRVSSLAGLLTRHCVAAEEPVAILMPKGPLQFIAVHGVIAAGAAYLPIDPDWPPRRIEFLLKDAGCRLVISDEPRCGSIGFEGVELQPPISDDGAFDPPADSRRLAYVLYTSGSTGAPKGVMIEHRSVVNRCSDVLNRFAIGEADRIFALTALHHDLSVFDLFGPLAAGASVLIPDAVHSRNPEHWATLMEREGATVWNSVPALLEMFVEFLEGCGSLPCYSIRLFLIAGDWIPVELPDRVRRLWPEAQFISMGGPTETTVWDICHPVEKSYKGCQSIPYGKPMRGSRYYAMDAKGAERPDWVSGELWIGGEGLARGYWRDEEKTKARFVAHPRTGERLFRSGDLGRFRPDGTIEFLGRIDHQLKIRGVRIEAGEVERALAAHPTVEQAIVQAVGKQTESKRHVAFVIRSTEPARAPGQEEDLAQHWLLRCANRNRWDELQGEAYVDLQNISRASDLALQRRSQRYFAGNVEVGALASCLQMLCGTTEAVGEPGRFRYPSAGSLYPVHVYVAVAPHRVNGLDGGIYLYNPWLHRLVLVSSDSIPARVHLEHNRCMADSAAFLILFVGHLPAIEPRYGAKSRDYCLLEAGHMSQLIMLEAATHGLGMCPIGEFDETAVKAALRLQNGDCFLQAMAGGKPANACSSSTDFLPRRTNWREELIGHLRTMLPDSMIPEQWIALDRFPLTPNGKLDRAALGALALDAGQHQDLAIDETPSSGLEETLAHIVGDTLGLDRVPVNARFFELGCDSIGLVRIFVCIRNQESSLKITEPIRMTDMFEFPTVRLLAKKLGSKVLSDESVESAAARGRARARAARGRA